LGSEDLNRASKCVFEFFSGPTCEHLNAGFGRRLRIQPASTPGGKVFFLLKDVEIVGKGRGE